MPVIVKLAQAMGIELKLITADEAYHDKDGSLMAETGVILTTPPSAKVVAPEHTDTATGDDGGIEMITRGGTWHFFLHSKFS